MNSYHWLGKNDMNTIVLNKLVLVGQNKEDAVIDFSKGLNVISGPSNTGKSFIFECLAYALGASKSPKDIKESTGYTTVFLTFTSNDGTKTIERSILGGKNVNIYNSSYDNINEASPETMSSDNNANNSLSKYLLSLINMDGKKLKKNKDDVTSSLTFSLLRKIVMISETKIQSIGSPIYVSGQVIDETKEQSLFKYLITGVDFSSLIQKKKKEIVKAETLSKIETINEIISKNPDIFQDLDKTTSEELADQLDKLNFTINDAIDKFSQNKANLGQIEKDRKVYYENYILHESKIKHCNELISRFTLLDKRYESDIDRLEAIYQTGSIISLIETSYCPICGSNSDAFQIDKSMNLENIKNACNVEKGKIAKLKQDLESTIKDIKDQLEYSQTQKNENGRKCKQATDMLENSFKPLFNEGSSNLQALFDKKKNLEIKISFFDLYKEIERSKELEQIKLKSKNSKEESIKPIVSVGECKSLIEEIKSFLVEWKYPNIKDVDFSEVDQDIVIDSVKRSSLGKGYRSITHAAFIIGLMNNSFNKNLPHPGFVIIDSPLTTLRQGDKFEDADNEVDELSVDMKKGFYKDLANITNDRQIIIIENDEPSADIASKINLIKFTQDINGRYGFIPIKNN